jgi:hypothetical protein
LFPSHNNIYWKHDYTVFAGSLIKAPAYTNDNSMFHTLGQTSGYGCAILCNAASLAL